MSGTTVQPSSEASSLPPQLPSAEQESAMGVLIEDRIHRVRQQVKVVDIIAQLMQLMVGGLVYLFLAAIVDHWLVTGGLGFWGRTLIWLVMVAAALFYTVKFILPSIVLRINPVYAAQTIEQSKPTLKNSLVNFLLLRNQQNQMAPVIYQALEQRAAIDLKSVPLETAVDRRPILQLSYFLAAVVAVICLYLAISPKNPLLSAERILLPWSNIPAPTRVTIDNVKPGNLVAFHGDFITISADVRGLDDNEPVLLHYSTSDKEVVDQTIPLKKEGEAFRYQTNFPSDNLGLQQDYSYFLAAGDFKTETFKIVTQIAPSIVVDKIDYHYPSYTGIPDNSLVRQGDIRAIEGTRVTIHATTNQAIDHARIDFSGTRSGGIPMKSNDRTASGEITLKMSPNDPTKPEYNFYQLLFTDKNKRENNKPIRYNIEVLRDLPPEIQIVQPQQEEAVVPEDGKLDLVVRAQDPDFGLRRVAFLAEKGQQRLTIPAILDQQPPEKAVSGEYRGTYVFEPKKFNLKAGDRIFYWAEAEDNKEPAHNVTVTGKQSILVVAPEHQQSQNNQKPTPAPKTDEKNDKNPANLNDSNQNQKPGDKSQENQQDEKQSPANDKQGENQKSDKNDDGMKGDKGNNANKNEQRDDDKTNKPQDDKNKDNKTKEPIDPKSNPGDAIQEILKDRQQQEQKEQQKSEPEKQKNDQQNANDQQKGDPQKNNQQKPDQQAGNGSGDQNKTGDQKQSDQKQDNKQNNKQSPESQSNSKQQPKDEKNGQQQAGKGKAGKDQKGGNQQTGDPQSGEEQTGGSNQSGKPQKNGGKSGDNANNKQQSNNQQTPGSKQNGNNQSSANKTGNEQQNADQNNTAQQENGKNQPTGGKKSNDKATGKDKSAENGQQTGKEPSSGEKQSADKNQTGDNDNTGSADKQPGEKQFSEKKSNDKNSSADGKNGDQLSENKQGDDKSGEGQKSGTDNKLTDQKQSTGKDGESKQQKSNNDAPGKQQTNKSDQAGKEQNKKPSDGKSGNELGKEQNPKNDTADSKQSDTGKPNADKNANNKSNGGNDTGNQKTDEKPDGSQAADSGKSQSNDKGNGDKGKPRGEKPNDQKPSGSASNQKNGDNSKGENQPDGKGDMAKKQQPNESANGKPQENPSDGGQTANKPGEGQSARSAGNPTTGGERSSQEPTPTEQQEAQQSTADAINLDYARKQTELALEHLEDQLAKDKPELLEKLGWTREQAQQFIDRWQQLQREAKEKGPRGEAAKKQFDDALKSLGLRPGSTVIKHGGVKGDQMRDLRDAGRFAPPAEWAEQFREYTRGVANQGTGDRGQGAEGRGQR